MIIYLLTIITPSISVQTTSEIGGLIVIIIINIVEVKHFNFYHL